MGRGGPRVHDPQGLTDWPGQLRPLLPPAERASQPRALDATSAAPLRRLDHVRSEHTPWVVSKVLGHASVAIIKDIYGHLIGDEKREATEAITDVLFDNSRPGDKRTPDKGA